MSWKSGVPTNPTVYDWQFKIVVTYEATVSLGVQNLGTGKSLELKWQADAQTAEKVRGYKVYRREKQ